MVVRLFALFIMVIGVGTELCSLIKDYIVTMRKTWKRGHTRKENIMLFLNLILSGIQMIFLTSSFPYCMKLEEPSSFCGKILLALRMSYMLIILVRIFKVTIYLKRNEKWGWAEIKGYGLGVIIYLIIGLNTKVHKEQSPKQ
ncbi:MAG: hypothetical protein KHZ94_07320 [Anaerostipes sp.]|uniref:hypothetical protein n=1 Tax=Anaerostipes sp. TaxID=1872530 RepID=UPI00257AD1BC|nr:hypothetical protein [Anaerostipes sp.]MBS4928196.1 hypothetical protein [Anaerostipes sp.]